MTRRMRTLLIGVALATLGCTPDRSNPMQPARTPPSIRGLVTGDALDYVDASGRFRLSDPRAPDDVSIISPERARELAQAFMRTWGESYSPVWQLQRGAPLPGGPLTLSPRIYHAATPHGRFPDGFHGAYRRMFGPQYLLFFESGGTPVLGVSVAAYSGDLRIENGLIREPYEGGSYFTTQAVASTGRWRYSPISPEEAVVVVNEKTGARAAAVPELVLRAGWHPLLALWRVSLDRRVTLHRRGPGANGAAQVSEIYVGPGSHLFLPSDGQDAAISVAAERHPFNAAAPPVTVELHRRGPLPLRFDEVTPNAEQP